ncbi:MAG: DNA-binding protein [Firmicutes bacterium]|nr:DNA-binding protein [Bacillota bacterium]MBU4533798.1 DNA-binding protein [Bacillota bacterium]MBV1727162.1 DNA-binding protein [Desulforudis sp.]MBV1736345.1 DNA-binding protein [Desulforudis sp.]
MIGAVTRARVGYYNQTGRSYHALEWNEHLEILCLVGNVSVKDGAPFVHAHVTLSDRFGGVRGGHLFGRYTCVCGRVCTPGAGVPGRNS